MTFQLQQSKETHRLDSEKIVGVSVEASLDEIEYRGGVNASQVKKEAATKPTSVIPPRVNLNEQGNVTVVRSLQSAGETAFADANKNRPLVSISTADMISHTSFKKDSKFVLRVVPTQDNKSKDSNTVRQSELDQAFYFDKASLQSTAEVNEERYQLFEAFDSETVFLFGERPKIWNFQFVVLNGSRPEVPNSLKQSGNTKVIDEFMKRNNMDFCDELMRRYERYYRGSAALKMRARVYMSYEDILIEATLVGLVVSRNANIGAANVGLTFIVHERQFLGSDLTFGSDQTLSQLLRSEDQADLVRKDISPSTIISPAKNLNQLIAEYGQNQQETAKVQEEASKIQKEKELASVSLTESEQIIANNEQQVQLLTARFNTALTDEEKQKIKLETKQAQDRLQKAKSEAQSLANTVEQSDSALTEKSKELITSISKQQTLEESIKHSAEVEGQSINLSIIYLIEFVTVDESGQVNLKIYQAPNSEAAEAIRTGEDPKVSGGFLVSSEILDSSDPRYQEQKSSVTVKTERR